jgi:class 3 adenylate cyclase
MFLDLNDSTRLAEKLGDIGVQALLRQFFYDAADPVVRYGGETHLRRREARC